MGSELNPASPSVWVLHPSNDWYGADVAVLRTVEVLVASGAQVLVTLPRDASSTAPMPLDRRLEALGVEVERGELPVLRRNRKSIRGLVQLLALTARFLVRARHSSAKVVLVNSSSLALCLPALRLRRDRRVVVHLHETLVGAEGSVLGALLLFGHRVVAISPTAHRALPSQVQKRATIVENAVDAPVGSLPAPFLEGPLRFLFIGRWSPRKGLAELLGAWERVGGSDRHLYIIGGFPPDGERAAVDPWSVRSPSVTVVGEVSEVDSWIDRSHVIVVPSVQPEGLGLVALESLARGRPLVATAAGGLQDVVDNSVGWILPEDHAKWDEVLCRVTLDGIRQRQEACLALHRQRFSGERYRTEMLEVLLGEGGR